MSTQKEFTKRVAETINQSSTDIVNPLNNYVYRTSLGLDPISNLPAIADPSSTSLLAATSGTSSGTPHRKRKETQKDQSAEKRKAPSKQYKRKQVQKEQSHQKKAPPQQQKERLPQQPKETITGNYLKYNNKLY